MGRGQGQENPAFDGNNAPPQEAASGDGEEGSDKKSSDLASLPMYEEVSLNGDSMKKMSGAAEKEEEASGGPASNNNVGEGDKKKWVCEKGILENEEEENDEDMRCGFGCFSPEWIQKYATKRDFMIFFALLGVIQGMTWSYFTATITTLEKRFKISSQTAGFVMTGNEISQILFSLVISYFGGKGHRPRWISAGVLFSALSCFVLASPQVFYGSGNDALLLTEEYSYLYDKTFEGMMMAAGNANLSSFDEIEATFSSSSTPAPLKPSMGNGNRGRVTLCQRRFGSRGMCEDENANAAIDLAPLVIIFMSQFVAGLGNLLFFSLGGPYLDDNTSRSNMPRVLGMTMSLRLIGPTIGYLIASGSLKLYVNPSLTPIISQDDPRWQGAWWLGWVVFGTAMIIMSGFIALFPRKLRRKNRKSVNPDKINSPDAIPKLSDIPIAVKILLTNKVNLFNNLAGVFYLFSAIGYWTYMPKYLETIFMQTASNASIISGAVGILFQSTGMLISGLLISKFQPRARILAGWNVAVAFGSVAVMISFTQLGCDVGNVNFGIRSPDATWNLTTSCNVDCNCKTSRILPVCHRETNTVYYSACHAGCTTYHNNGTVSNCLCIDGVNEGEPATVTLGNCAEGCTNIFLLFLGISALIKFCDATGRIGNMLVSYRCVDLKDRSLSIGLHILLTSLFSFLPSPILFGWIIDNVCLVWGNSACGNIKGNCMLYDGAQLRYIFNLTAAAFTLAGGILDCAVFYYVKDMDLYKEPEEEKISKLEQGHGTGEQVTTPKNGTDNENKQTSEKKLKN